MRSLYANDRLSRNVYSAGATPVEFGETEVYQGKLSGVLQPRVLFIREQVSINALMAVGASRFVQAV